MKRNRLVVAVSLMLAYFNTHGQPKTDSFLTQLLKSSGSPVANRVLNSPDSFRCQVIYTQIDRDRKGRPTFKNFYFNVDRNLYFNPASMVKLPLAALSMEKLRVSKKAGLDRETVLVFDSSFARQVPLYKDSTSKTGSPSLAQFIRKAFLISDNDAYNRMYQFVGQQTINRRLHQLGYPDTRITRQFMGFSEEGNRHTNPVRFLDDDGSVILIQPPAYNRDSFHFPQPVLVGNGYLDRNDSLIEKPFDFTRHNNLPLEDLSMLLRSIIFPASMPKKKRFSMDEDDRQFMLQYLSQFPSETSYPKYDTNIFYDSYVKYFFRDSSHPLPANVRVFNKVGWAYGFLTDVSYVADTCRNIEYMLAATVYVNPDGILNDDQYEYDQTGYPFLRAIGKVVYQYELGRKRSVKATLPPSTLRYDKRDPADTRSSIRNVDN